MVLDLAGLLVSIKGDTHSDIDQSLIARLDVLVSRADAKISQGEVDRVLLDELYASGGAKKMKKWKSNKKAGRSRNLLDALMKVLE